MAEQRTAAIEQPRHSFPYSVACVLKSGGRYDPSWVHRLADDVRYHCWMEDLTAHSVQGGVREIVCLTDMELGNIGDGVRTVPLKHNWPGWWSKMELFRPDLYWASGRILYLDLDSIVCGDLACLAAASRPRALSALRDFYCEDYCGSGVMAWQPYDAGELKISQWARKIYRLFQQWSVCDAWDYPRGDQAWLMNNIESAELLRIQDEAPGKVVSYKVHCQDEGRAPDGAAVICFHGEPKQDTLPPDHWTAQL